MFVLDLFLLLFNKLPSELDIALLCCALPCQILRFFIATFLIHHFGSVDGNWDFLSTQVPNSNMYSLMIECFVGNWCLINITFLVRKKIRTQKGGLERFIASHQLTR